ncbi:aryl-sulfate sulfotransferase, partial [Escherichia coli]|nr:aryl-sulfate sulfotransferase [Escherichia coli]
PTKGTTITGGQHDLTLLSSKNGKLKVLLYDNNIDVTNGNAKTSGKYSQAVQYTIDTKKKTIKQTWSYGKSLGKDNFTRVIGSAQRLSNGNTLIDFGYK